MANLNYHMPIMVSVAVYAIRFATGPKLPRGLSCRVWVRENLEGMRGKN